MMSMTIESMANVILNNCDNVSNKKLQKLSYYVYAWHLVVCDKKISDVRFEAWEHGPVCRRLYNKYKKYGWNAIPKYEGFVLANGEEIKFIQSVISVYGDFSADELECMTHKESPWLKTRSNVKESGVLDAYISDEDIIDCYSQQVDIKDRILKEIA